MKTPKIIARPYLAGKHPKYKFVVDLRSLGKGRKHFQFRAEAEAYAAREVNMHKAHGMQAVGLPAHVLSDLIKAHDQMAKYGETISDAVEFRVDYLERVRRCKITVAELTEEVLDAKRKDGRSKRYIDDLRLKFARFCQDFGEKLIAEITVEQLDDWLRHLDCAPKTRANYRSNIGVLFSYAAQRRMIDFNPVALTSKPKLIDKAPEIFTVDELRALLEAAQRTEPDALPMLAIGAFAGLRDAEIKRLDWSEVDIARKHIEVKAAKAKSARRRIVPMQPNLSAWLQPFSAMKGRLVPVGAHKKLDRIRKAAGLIRWPNNGLRHSFASYRLAATHDAPRVASELGHTSPHMLYSTYRELVLPSEAERYWKIEPRAETANLVAFSASA